MDDLSIPLPDSMRNFVEQQASQGGYPTPAEYVQDLIRAAQRREAKARLEAQLLEGLEGQTTEMSSEDWDGIVRDGEARLAARKPQ